MDTWQRRTIPQPAGRAVRHRPRDRRAGARLARQSGLPGGRAGRRHGSHARKPLARTSDLTGSTTAPSVPLVLLPDSPRGVLCDSFPGLSRQIKWPIRDMVPFVILRRVRCGMEKEVVLYCRQDRKRAKPRASHGVDVPPRRGRVTATITTARCRAGPFAGPLQLRYRLCFATFCTTVRGNLTYVKVGRRRLHHPPSPAAIPR